MKPKRKLKVIPIYRFFLAMNTPSKLLFLVLFGGLVSLAVASVVVAENPVRWAIEVNESHLSTQEEVVLREYQQNYREMHTEIGAWKDEVSFVATPIVPKAWMVLLFVIGQVIGWAFLMSAATYIKNLLAYVVYFGFALVFALSGTFESIAPDNYWLYNLGLLVLLFGPAFLLQQGILRLAFPLRLLIFTVLTALPFFLQFENQGWMGLHNSTVGMFPPLALILIVYIFFVGSDISNLMFFLATNSKKKQFRLQFPYIFGIFLVITALEFMMLQHELRWELVPFPDNFPFRPIHLLALASVVMVGTKQNMYPILKSYIDNRAMSMIFAALSLIAMSTFFFHASLGDYFFVLMIERLVIILFTLTGLFHFFYIFYNFGPLIRARINFYYLSMMPKRLLYFFVVIATALIGFALEASQGVKTRRFFTATIYSRLADQEFMSGNIGEAMAFYNSTVAVSDGSIKGNYNMAMLAMVVERPELAREHFTKARRYNNFPYSALNQSVMELDQKSPSQALYVLRENEKRVANPYVSNNLALLHKGYNRPDSAVIQLKKALHLAPDNAVLYSNLARVYMENDKPEWATKFLQAGLELENPGAAVIINSLYHNIRHDAGLVISDSLLKLPEVQAERATLFNFALERYRAHNYTAAKVLTDTLLARGETPDVLLLDGMLLFEQGKIQEALSRMLYLDASYRDYRKYAYHYLGVAFFGAQVPEIAAEYFRLSAASGRKEDQMNQARMEIDRGDHKRAFHLLNELRAEDSTMFDPVSRELVMLQLARGDYFFASIGFDMSSLTKDEWTRIGIYAGQIGSVPGALEAFRRLIEKDSSSVIPYLEMGRIGLKLNDPLVFDNLQPGLDLEPENVGLNTILARAHLKAGNVDKALPIYRKLIQKAPEDVDVRLLEAEVVLATGDTSASLSFYKKIHEAYPLNQKGVIGLSKLYRAKEMDFEGQNMVFDALDINPRNADFWYEMAHFERMLNREMACGGAAVQAAQLSIDPEKEARIREEFKPEIAAYTAEYPEEPE
jgi:predicted Zn-dependent protease